jgi:hypothetical protein
MRQGNGNSHIPVELLRKARDYKMVGYGDAINAQVAKLFIESVMDVLKLKPRKSR